MLRKYIALPVALYRTYNFHWNLHIRGGPHELCPKILKLCRIVSFHIRNTLGIGTENFNFSFKIMGRMMHPNMYIYIYIYRKHHLICNLCFKHIVVDSEHIV